MKFWKDKFKKRQKILALGVIIVAVTIGGLLLLKARASSPTSAVNAQTGSLTGFVDKVTDITAANGAFLRFGRSARKVIVGYFVQWGVYARNYHVKNIVTSGSATKLTHINYAFANIADGKCISGDNYADFDQYYDAASSVDGVADSWEPGALRGNFNQFRKLKAIYPQLKVIFSVGGWGWSSGFTQAAANPTTFADSCYNLIHDSRWAGVFDGIDIDWEFPNACGLQCDNSGREGFRNLMAALRTRFGSEIVTAAVSGAYPQINAADYGGAAQYVDWYNVMAYDYFGVWDANGPTAPIAPLISYSGIPIPNLYADYGIQLYKNQGVAPNKLILGVPFSGHGWNGVTGGGDCSLGGSATGPAPGKFEAGVNDYKVLKDAPGSVCRGAGTMWKYDTSSKIWWSYDDPISLVGKQGYVKDQSLGGVMFWELSGDTSNGELISALYNK